MFGAIVVLMIFGGLSAFVGYVGSWLRRAGSAFWALIGGVVFIVILVISLPGLIIGIGLMQFRPWARIGGIVLSALDLLGFPFHTILGIYGLWVLLNRETEQMFLGVPPARVA